MRATRRGLTAAAALALLSLALCLPAHPQGCSQCRETVGQTPARTQQAYRRGIGIMIFAAGTVFVGSVAAIRRFR